MSVVNLAVCSVIVAASLTETWVMPIHMIEGATCVPTVRSGTQCAPLEHAPHEPNHPRQIVEAATTYTSTSAFNPHASVNPNWLDGRSSGPFPMV